METEEIEIEQKELITNVKKLRELVELKYSKKKRDTDILDKPTWDITAEETKRALTEDVNTDYKTILEDALKLKIVQVRVIAYLPKNFFNYDNSEFKQSFVKNSDFRFMCTKKNDFDDIKKKVQRVIFNADQQKIANAIREIIENIFCHSQFLSERDNKQIQLIGKLLFNKKTKEDYFRKRFLTLTIDLICNSSFDQDFIRQQVSSMVKSNLLFKTFKELNSNPFTFCNSFKRLNFTNLKSIFLFSNEKNYEDSESKFFKLLGDYLGIDCAFFEQSVYGGRLFMLDITSYNEDKFIREQTQIIFDYIAQIKKSFSGGRKINLAVFGVEAKTQFENISKVDKNIFIIRFLSLENNNFNHTININDFQNYFEHIKYNLNVQPTVDYKSESDEDQSDRNGRNNTIIDHSDSENSSSSSYDSDDDPI